MGGRTFTFLSTAVVAVVTVATVAGTVLVAAPPSSGETCVRSVDATDPSVTDPEADLVAALAAANGTSCTDWRVELTGTFPLTDTLEWIEPIPLHLVGPAGATTMARIEAVGASPGHRLLTVDTFPDVVAVTLERLVLQGGNVEGADPPTLAADPFANQGGAILADDVILIDVELAGNAADIGGAIVTADLTATRTSFVSNRADAGTGRGGAVDAIGAVTLTNVTFAGNSAKSGGALHLDGAQGLTASLDATNVTFLGNRSAVGGGADLHLVGSAAQLPVSLRGVLLGANDVLSAGTACAGGRFGDLANGFTIAESLAAETGCGVPVDAGVAALDAADYDTVAFRDGTSSLRVPPGAWAGIDAYACEPTDGWPTTDQRGVARPQGDAGRCEVGAVEVVPPAPPPPAPPPPPTTPTPTPAPASDPEPDVEPEPDPALETVAGPVPTSIPAGGGGCADGCP